MDHNQKKSRIGISAGQSFNSMSPELKMASFWQEVAYISF